MINKKEISKSPCLGFSLIIIPYSALKRKEVVDKLMRANLECRSIVTIDFTQIEVIKYFDYEIHDELNNA